jgi:hypothetical protein
MGDMQEHFPETKVAEVAAGVKQSRIAEWMQIHGTAVLGGAISSLVVVLVLVLMIKLIRKARRMLRARGPVLSEQEQEQRQLDLLEKNIQDKDGIRAIADRLKHADQKQARDILDKIRKGDQTSPGDEVELKSALHRILDLKKGSSDKFTMKAWGCVSQFLPTILQSQDKNIVDAFKNITEIYKQAYPKPSVTKPHKIEKPRLSTEEQKWFDAFVLGLQDIDDLRTMTDRLSSSEQQKAKDILDQIRGGNYQPDSEKKKELGLALRRIFGMEESASDALTVRVFKHIQVFLSKLDIQDQDKDVAKAFDDIDEIYEQADLKPSVTKSQEVAKASQTM